MNQEQIEIAAAILCISRGQCPSHPLHHAGAIGDIRNQLQIETAIAAARSVDENTAIIVVSE